MSRLTVHFEGRVQGVGFRFTARTVAQNYVISGYVENLADGRVKAVIEGEPDQAQAFVAGLGQRMAANITDTHIERGQATGEFGPPAQGAFGVRP